jgi:hypothetical protein
MDLVVRTPHGDADITIVRGSCTLGDLIAAVSGQAVPRVARVDDRTVDCATPLDDAGLRIGSIVTTDPEVATPHRENDVTLVQIAGPGAGRSHTMSPGRYRIGPGRRLMADELSAAAVEEPAFVVVVTPGGGVTVELASDHGPTIRLGGAPVRSGEAWADEILTVDTRAFAIDRRQASDDRPLPSPDADGTVAFNRPPRRPDAPARLPVIDAVRDAHTARPSLWQRRPGQHGAYVVPIGIRERDGIQVVELDLFNERAVALAGSEAARTALARAILVEAATIHGPADLGLAIVTTPDRLAEWDWAKWLPHLRFDGCPTVLSAPDEIAAWADPRIESSASAATPRTSGHLTLLVVDDPDFWRRRESPLRSLMSSPPPDLRVIALCDEADHAPAACTTLLTESSDRHWQLSSLSGHELSGHQLSGQTDIAGVSGALVESGVAVEIARSLAPLVDTELPHRVVGPDRAAPRRSLLDCLGDPTPDDLRRNWADPEVDLTAVPFCTDRSIGLDLASNHVVVTASDAFDADRVAATIAAGACTRLGPSEMLLLDLLGATSPLIGELPHAVEGATAASGTAIEHDRLIARIRHVLALHDAPRFVVATIGADVVPSLRDALLVASAELAGLRLIVATVDPLDHSDATNIGVERRGDRRCAVVDTPGGRVDVQLDEDPTEEPDLVLRPFVIGRALTPLEHRLHQRSRSVPPTFVAECRDLARRALAAAGDIATPWLVPPPLPSSIDAEALFAQWPGDAVPIGLVDRPATGLEPMWWQPADGLLVAIGSSRSGVDDLLAIVLLGMIDRIAPAEARLAVVDGSVHRRRLVETIDPVHVVVAPDDVMLLLERLEETRRPDDPRLVIVIDDLGRLRSHAASLGTVDRLDQGLIAAGSVVAVARTADDAGALMTATGRHLVGSVADSDDQEPPDGALGGTRGRCRLLETGEVVQLAALDRPFESAGSARLTHGPDGIR